MGFGGFGESGMGSYHGRKGFDCFTHEKSIVDKKLSWICRCAIARIRRRTKSLCAFSSDKRSLDALPGAAEECAADYALTFPGNFIKKNSPSRKPGRGIKLPDGICRRAEYFYAVKTGLRRINNFPLLPGNSSGDVRRQGRFRALSCRCKYARSWSTAR